MYIWRRRRVDRDCPIQNSVYIYTVLLCAVGSSKMRQHSWEPCRPRRILGGYCLMGRHQTRELCIYNPSRWEDDSVPSFISSPRNERASFCVIVSRKSAHFRALFKWTAAVKWSLDASTSKTTTMKTLLMNVYMWSLLLIHICPVLLFSLPQFVHIRIEV